MYVFVLTDLHPTTSSSSSDADADADADPTTPIILRSPFRHTLFRCAPSGGWRVSVSHDSETHALYHLVAAQQQQEEEEPPACLLTVEEWVVTGSVQPKVDILRAVLQEETAAKVFVVVPDPSAENSRALVQFVVSSPTTSRTTIVPWFGNSRDDALRALFMEAVAGSSASTKGTIRTAASSVLDSLFSYLDQRWYAFGIA